MQTTKVSRNELVREIEKLKKRRLMAITAIDGKGTFTVLYQFDGNKVTSLELSVPKKKPIIRSIIKVFPGASIYECEIHDLFGIEFEGNPDLEHGLFLAGELKGKHPLRRKGKDA